MIPVLIVPTMIHYDLLQKMINSIDVQIDELIIIDNGGKLKSIECSNANKISIINMPRNLGVATSWNLGIKLTPYSKWWMIASDDIIFNPDKLQKIIDSNFDSIVFNKMNDRFFSAFAIHENLINKIGLFNEYFYPGVGEEIDYIQKIYENNIKVFHINDLFKHHDMGGNTLKYFGLDKNASGPVAGLLQEAMSYNNKTKLNDWDLTYRRYVEQILNPIEFQ